MKDRDRLDRANRRLVEAQRQRDQVVKPQQAVINSAYFDISEAQRVIDEAEDKFNKILKELTAEVDAALGF